MHIRSVIDNKRFFTLALLAVEKSLSELARYLGVLYNDAFDFTFLKVPLEFIQADLIDPLPLLQHHHYHKYRNGNYKITERSPLISGQGRFARSVLQAATL